MIHPQDLADFHMYKVRTKTLQNKILTKALSTKLTTFSIKTFLEEESTFQVLYDASHIVMTPQAPFLHDIKLSWISYLLFSRLLNMYPHLTILLSSDLAFPWTTDVCPE